MGEANRRAIAQGFNDAEHRRLYLSVEGMQRKQMHRYGKTTDLIARQKELFDARPQVATMSISYEQPKRYDRKADVLAVNKHQELIGKDGLGHYVEDEPAMRLSSSYSASEEYAKEIAASGNGRLIIEEMSKAEFEVRYPDHEPLVVYDAPTNGNVSIEPGVVYTVATEPLTTKKICAGEYEVTRNRDGAKYRIDKARSGWWQLNDDGVVSRHDTLAAAKAAIPA